MKGIKRKIKIDGVLCRTVTEAALKVGCTPMDNPSENRNFRLILRNKQTTMTEKEIIRLAQETRTAQKDYFATRSRADRNNARNLERRLDEAIQEYNNQNPQLLIDILVDGNAKV